MTDEVLTIQTTMTIEQACAELSRRKWRGRDDWQVVTFANRPAAATPISSGRTVDQAATDVLYDLDAIAIATGLLAQEELQALRHQVADRNILFDPKNPLTDMSYYDAQQFHTLCAALWEMTEVEPDGVHSCVELVAAQLQALRELHRASNASVMDGLRRIARAIGDTDPSDLGGVHILAGLVEFVVRKRDEAEREVAVLRERVKQLEPLERENPTIRHTVRVVRAQQKEDFDRVADFEQRLNAVRDALKPVQRIKAQIIAEHGCITGYCEVLVDLIEEVLVVLDPNAALHEWGIEAGVSIRTMESDEQKSD